LEKGVLRFEKKNVVKGKEKKRKKNGVVSVPLVGRHVVNEPKVGCHYYNELEIS
jgi:hypothetical protein